MVCGGIPDPQLNCAAPLDCFFELQYIGFAAHDWTFTYANQVLGREAYP